MRPFAPKARVREAPKEEPKKANNYIPDVTLLEVTHVHELEDGRKLITASGDVMTISTYVSPGEPLAGMVVGDYVGVDKNQTMAPYQTFVTTMSPDAYVHEMGNNEDQ